MIKDYNTHITKNICFHFGGEAMFYLIPTLAFSKLDWEPIIDKKEISYLAAIKWFNYSAGFTIKINK